MTYSLSHDERVTDLAEHTRSFISSTVLPIEDEHDGDIHQAGGDELRVKLQEAARSAGIFAPHVSRELGGHGLGMVDRAPVFEAAGYSVFGPVALNIAAPDEGNMHLLEHVASPAQRERFLVPLAAGSVRSAFAMTEPAPGAGSDPSALRTLAVRDTDGWVINGDKKFITGADGRASSSSWPVRQVTPEVGAARPCSSSTRQPMESLSVGTWRRWTGPWSAVTARSRSGTCGWLAAPCWARSTRASTTRRCGLVLRE